MPDIRGRFTDKEERFMKAYLDGADQTRAAEKAGYSHPVVRGSEIMKKPAVCDEIARRSTAELHNELVPLALGRLRKILENDDISPQHHIAAGKVVLGAADKRTDAATGKSLSEMNMAETEAMLSALRAEHARKQAETLEPIEAAPPGEDVFG